MFPCFPFLSLCSVWPEQCLWGHHGRGAPGRARQRQLQHGSHQHHHGPAGGRGLRGGRRGRGGCPHQQQARGFVSSPGVTPVLWGVHAGLQVLQFQERNLQLPGNESGKSETQARANCHCRIMECPEVEWTHKYHPVQPLAVHRHPNSPTLCIQTFLELWQPWGTAHSLGNLLCGPL